jgi:hypothetical protein
LASKLVPQVFQFGPQNRQLRFDDLGLKITMTVSSFWPQNKVGYGLSVAPQNRREDKDSVGRTSRSSCLLHLKASQARVSQSGLKTDGGVARMVQMASSQRLHRVKAEDGQADATGCVKLFYPNFVIFYILGSRGILVF